MPSQAERGFETGRVLYPLLNKWDMQWPSAVLCIWPFASLGSPPSAHK